MTTSETLRLYRAAAFWYACGYNDHRPPTGTQPYVDPDAFAEHWAIVCDQGSRPSLQDVFKAYVTTLECTRCDGNGVITVGSDRPDYWGNYDTDEVACPECQEEE